MSAIASPFTNRLLIGGWAAASTLWAALMFLLPGQETVPFHFIWIGLALVYGFTRWRRSGMLTSMITVTLVTGAILIHHAEQGIIGWEETAEVPLMAALFGVMVWHVNRRNEALAEVRRMADAECRRLEVQQLFLRLASHELRTPITIARGYTELVRAAHPDEVTREDTDVVLEELDKVARISQRVVTLMQMEEPYPLHDADLDEELGRIVRRWLPTVDRRWSCASSVGVVRVNTERLEAAIDSLIENAVKFTGPGDTITVEGAHTAAGWQVTVSDEGSGMSADQVARLRSDEPAGRAATATGTGLGYAIVRSVVTALGGEVQVDSRPGQGTTVTLTVPADVAVRTMSPRSLDAPSAVHHA
jgi:signal transduction histidine kinase